MRKNTVLKWILLIVLMGYAAWMSIWAHQEADRHVCVGIDIHVSGNKAMDSIIRRGVTRELASYPDKIIGTGLNKIDTGKLRNYLSSMSNFESVDCMITSGGRLRINIVPLVPVMRVFSPGKSYYINKDGKHIDSKAEFFTEAPVVQGEFTKDFPPSEVIPLVKYIDKDPMLKNLVSMIVAQDSYNLLVVPRMYGHIINFGDTTRLEEKTRALSLFYKKVMPHKGWEEYDTISVKFRGQIVATRRDKTRLSHSEDYTEVVDLEEHTLPDAPQPAATSNQSPANSATPTADSQPPTTNNKQPSNPTTPGNE